MPRSYLILLAAAACACDALVLEPRQPVLPRACGAAIDAADGTSSACVLSSALQLRGGAGGSLTNWWYKTLAKLGIFLKKGRLLVLGLDNAGKSTLLTVLLRNEVVPTAPTHQPVTDEVSGHGLAASYDSVATSFRRARTRARARSRALTRPPVPACASRWPRDPPQIKIGHMKVRAVDMGGHEIARKMWLQYSHEADGIVYIVDAVDRERFPEAALELHKLLAAQALPPGAPVLILANKVDLPHAAQQEELYYALGLDELAQSGGQQRPVGLYLCSIFERRGYMEGFDWLGSHI